MVQPLICGTRVCDFVFKVGVTNLSEEKKNKSLPKESIKLSSFKVD